MSLFKSFYYAKARWQSDCSKKFHNESVHCPSGSQVVISFAVSSFHQVTGNVVVVAAAFFCFTVTLSFAILCPQVILSWFCNCSYCSRWCCWCCCCCIDCCRQLPWLMIACQCDGKLPFGQSAWNVARGAAELTEPTKLRSWAKANKWNWGFQGPA